MAHCQIFETYSSINEMHRSNENGRITLSGVFGVCGTRNNNHRVYEKSNYGKMIAEMQSRIAKDGGIPGTLEHENSMYITLENVSHKVTKVNIDEDGVVTGTIELLDTPKGKIAQAIVEGGLPLFISSRAMGQIDKNGNVTLEKLSTYDIVSAPGFSEARLHLNESQIMESLGDNCVCIIEKNNNDIQTMDENKILEKISELENQINDLQEINQELTERLDNSEQNTINEKILNGIQNWCINEFSTGIQKWVVNEFQPIMQKKMIDECKELIVEKVAPGIQQWVTEHFAPVVENWIVEQYSPQVENWVISQVAPGMQQWMTEHFAPEIENWVTENYGVTVQKMISDSLEETKDTKLKGIKETLSLLESMTATTKPQYSTKVITESNQEEPEFIKNMPETARVKYNMASKEIKESINRRAKIYDFSNEGAIERFWENINFDEIKPAENIYEGLDQIADKREREIRMAFRRKRANLF